MQQSDLFVLFLRTGLFTIGGGMAAVPLLEEALVPIHFKHDAFLSMIALSQSSPGSIGANMATYIGVSEVGILGGVVAVTGLVIPSFIVITLIARYLPHFTKYRLVQCAFSTVRPAVTGLILSVALSLSVAVLWGGGSGVKGIPLAIFLLITLLHFRYKLQSITLISIGAVSGMLFL